MCSSSSFASSTPFTSENFVSGISLLSSEKPCAEPATGTHRQPRRGGTAQHTHAQRTPVSESKGPRMPPDPPFMDWNRSAHRTVAVAPTRAQSVREARAPPHGTHRHSQRTDGEADADHAAEQGKWRRARRHDDVQRLLGGLSLDGRRRLRAGWRRRRVAAAAAVVGRGALAVYHALSALHLRVHLAAGRELAAVPTAQHLRVQAGVVEQRQVLGLCARVVRFRIGLRLRPTKQRVHRLAHVRQEAALSEVVVAWDHTVDGGRRV